MPGFGTLIGMGITKNYGRKTRRYKQLKEDLRALRLPCYLCGQAINYEVGFPHPDSFSAEHVKPRAKFVELAEDPGNLKAAHLKCNSAKSDQELDAGIGLTSRDW